MSIGDSYGQEELSIIAAHLVRRALIAQDPLLMQQAAVFTALGIIALVGTVLTRQDMLWVTLWIGGSFLLQVIIWSRQQRRERLDEGRPSV